MLGFESTLFCIFSLIDMLPMSQMFLEVILSNKFYIKKSNIWLRLGIRYCKYQNTHHNKFDMPTKLYINLSQFVPIFVDNSMRGLMLMVSN